MDYSAPTCGSCGHPMQPIGRLPRNANQPAIGVFMCEPCFRIISLEDGDTKIEFVHGVTHRTARN
jgi:hypothetical protein